MILTFNVLHHKDLSDLLGKAKAVAEYGLKNKCRSSAQVSQFGMKSALSNQILRKYVNNPKCKRITHIVVPVTSQSFKWNGKEIEIPCLKFTIPFANENVLKVKHIELDDKYAHISCEIECKPLIETHGYIGIDRNTTQHVLVASNLETGKILKLGKECQHIHKKYQGLRRAIQKDAKKHHKYRKIKKLKHRESNIIRNINHQISKKVVDYAIHEKCCLVLENLKNMRYQKKNKHPKQAKRNFRYSLNSWSYFQLGNFIEYKAKLLGIPVVFVPPQYTSQTCSICGAIGERKGKSFKCPHCGHADHADVNAGFNIAKLGNGRLTAERDVVKGNTDVPNGAMR